jgi:hypothetical protein
MKHILLLSIFFSSIVNCSAQLAFEQKKTIPDLTVSTNANALPVTQLQDSLTYVRKFFSFQVYEQAQKLSTRETQQLLQTTDSKLNITYNLGKIARPSAFLIAAGGTYLLYDGLKGSNQIGNVKGENYPYVKRSVPKVLSGIGLFIIGSCLFEYGNDLKERAIDNYNTKSKTPSAVSKLTLGVTPNGNLGLYLSLK